MLYLNVRKEKDQLCLVRFVYNFIIDTSALQALEKNLNKLVYVPEAAEEPRGISSRKKQSQGKDWILSSPVHPSPESCLLENRWTWGDVSQWPARGTDPALIHEEPSKD